MSNRTQHNAGRLNAGAAVASSVATQHANLPYRMDLYNSTGLAAFWTSWIDGKYKAELNAPGELTLTLPYSQTTWDAIEFQSRVKLYNDRGVLLETFNLSSPVRSVDESGEQTISISGRSLLAQLGQEVIASYAAGNEQQTITLPSATAGTFTLTFRGYKTAALAYNASAATIQTALRGLTSIGSGNVTVTGSAGGPWLVEFTGTLAATDVPMITGAGYGLTGTKAVRVTQTRSAQTIKQIVQSWLTNCQTSTNPINYGFIDSTIGDVTRTISVEGESILKALQDLQATVGGYMWVDPASSALYWKKNYGVHDGQFVRVGFNGNSFKESRSDEAVVTRVLAIGAGDSYESSLKSTWNSSNQATYGIIQKVITDKSINVQADLDAWAQTVGESLCVPRKHYEIGVIDLARLTSADYSIHELSVGAAIWASCDTFGATVSTTISSIERDLANPLGITITVINPDAGDIARGPERDAADTVADILAMVLDDSRDNGGFAKALKDELPGVLGAIADLTDPIPSTLAGLMDQMAAAGIGGGGGGGGGGLSLDTAVPPVIATTGAVGTSAYAAHGDHTHAQEPYVSHYKAAANKAALGTPAGLPDIWKANDTGRLYVVDTVGTGLVCINALE